MKKYLFFICLLSFFSFELVSQVQIFLIEFEMTRPTKKINPKDLSGMSDQMIKMVMDRQKENKKVRHIYTLTTNGQRSKYIYSHTEAPSNMKLIHTGMEYYKDFDSNRIIVVSPVMDSDTKIEEKMQTPEQWVLAENHEEKICEYMCKKAVSVEGNVTAWYTDQIPVPDGPEKYSGLPGMILKFEKKGEKTIVARKLTIAERNEEVIIPHRPKSISLEKFMSSIKIRQ